MKRLVLLLAILLFVGMLSGPVSAQTIDITVQTYWAEDTPSGASVLERIALFEEQYPDIKVTYQYVPFGELLTTILQQTLTRTLPEVVFADNPDIRHLAASGVFMDLTDWVDEWGQWDDFYLGPQYANSLDDRIYAVQLNTNNLALYYNREVLADLGIAEPPATWDEVMAVSEIILTETDIYPIAFCADNTEAGTWQFLPFLWSAGGSLMELDRPESIAAAQFWVDLVEKGYAPRDVVNWDQGDVAINFAGGRVAMMINGPWELAFNLAETDVDYGIAMIPVPDADLSPVVAMGGESFGIASTVSAEKAEAGWKFIQFLVAPENMANHNLMNTTIPTRGAAVEKVLEEDPRLASFIAQAEFALSRPIAGGGENYPSISAITRQAFQLAIAGMMSAEQAFANAAQEVRDLYMSEAEFQEAAAGVQSVLDDVFTAME